jgi:hypothetical protein
MNREGYTSPTKKMQESVMMMNMPVVIGKRDVKREFKAAGYGSIDTIVFEPETFDGYNTVYLWFRPTTSESVNQKRLDLQKNCGTYKNYIDPCCDKTPQNGCGERWFLLPNEERAEPPVFTEKTQRQLNETDIQINVLTQTVQRQTEIIGQLLGELDLNSHTKEDIKNYLLYGEHMPVSPKEDGLVDIPRTTQLETKIETIYKKNETYERKLAAIEKRFENMEQRIPSIPNDTYERKLAALEKRFDDCEFQLPSYSPPNDTYDRKLAALEKKFEGLYREMSYTASLTNKLDCRLRNAATCLTTDLE